MKTSEFRQAIRNLGFGFKETDEDILIFGVITVFKKIQRIDIFAYRIDGYEITKLLKLAIEYTETPIEEREEEKKYYFELYDGIDNNFPDRFLGLDGSDGMFYFDNEHKSFKCFKGEFTQTEIDDFPPEIKGAIECGFFKKVDVGEWKR